MWLLHFQAVLILIESASCERLRCTKRSQYRRGTAWPTAILLTIGWPSSLVEISAVCFSSIMVFAQIKRVGVDFSTPSSICHAPQSQSANILNWHLVLRKSGLLQGIRYTLLFLGWGMNPWLSLCWACDSQLKMSMSHPFRSKDDRDGSLCASRFDYIFLRHLRYLPFTKLY